MKNIKLNKKLHGFTIIELIIVIVIIGILSAIISMSLSESLAKTRDAQRSVNVRSLAEALERYYDINGEYPGCVAMTTSNLVSLSTKLGGLSVKTFNMPKYSAGNAIICGDISSNTSDVIAYTADTTQGCTSSGICLSFVLQYREESTGKILTINSRHLHNIAAMIAVGSGHSCAYYSNNRLYCWGQNSYGQLGNNSNSSSSVPVAVYTAGSLKGLSIKSIVAGGTYTCVIASDDNAYCWGWNGYGELGNNSKDNSNVPIAVDTSGVLNGLKIKQISAGSYTTCAIASNHRVYCWGQNNGRQLGDGGVVANSSVPIAVDTSGVLNGKNMTSISVGEDFACALDEGGHAYCWGSNYYGGLGIGSGNSSNFPVAVDASGVLSGLTINYISSNNSNVCVVASDNNAYCWGYRSEALGNNEADNNYLPVAVYRQGVLNGLSIKTISNGYEFSCAVASDGKLYCWGLENSGEIGDDSTLTSYYATPIWTYKLNGLTISDIKSYDMNSCAIASDGNIYCSGSNYYGQLGNNSKINSGIPVKVLSPK